MNFHTPCWGHRIDYAIRKAANLDSLARHSRDPLVRDSSRQQPFSSGPTSLKDVKTVKKAMNSSDRSGIIAAAQRGLRPAENPLMQKNQALNTALSTVQPDRLRTIIKNLCLLSPTAEEYIGHILLTPEDNTKPKKRKRTVSITDIEAKKKNQVLVPRFAKCIQCNEEYDTTLNSSKACCWHPGKLALIVRFPLPLLLLIQRHAGERERDDEGDFWADHDENCHGRISDLEDEYPEGFVWTCCEELGNEEGCERGRHRDTVGWLLVRSVSWNTNRKKELVSEAEDDDGEEDGSDDEDDEGDDED
jgi:hypothetical protein